MGRERLLKSFVSRTCMSLAVHDSRPPSMSANAVGISCGVRRKLYCPSCASAIPSSSSLS